MFSLCSLASLSAANALGIDFETEIKLYSESTYISRFNNLVHFTKVTMYPLHVAHILYAYAGLRIAQDSRSTPTVLYNDNQVTPLYGLEIRAPVIPLTLFAEHHHGLRLFDRAPAKPFYETDFRLGAFAYYWWKVLPLSGMAQLFDEVYGELIYSSRLDQNIFLSAWNKLGIRFSVLPLLHVDGYGEGFLKQDRLGVASENAQELRVGMRLSASFLPHTLAPLTLALSTHYGVGTQSSTLYQEWRSLLVFYMELAS